VRADLPGVDPNDLNVEVIYITERQYGRFYRAIPLPEGTRVGEATARYENGVLEVNVPTEEQRTERREIPIQASAPDATGSWDKKPA
jgi:HSP20 family molecular chaperone IbpA